MTVWGFWNRSKRSKSAKRKEARGTRRSVSPQSSRRPTLADRWGLESMFTAEFELLEHRQLMAGDVFTVTMVADRFDMDQVALGNGLSLREAIYQANNNNNATELDEIRFQIDENPGAAKTIIVSSSLIVTERVQIDGFTQTDAQANSLAVGSNANYQIQLQQSSPMPTADGTALLRIEGSDADGSIIRGLVINSLQGDQDAIGLYNTHQVQVQGNYIGIDITGMSSTDMGRNGIRIEGGGGNTIGGTNASDRNVIAGNYLSNLGADTAVRAMVLIGNTSGSNANVVVNNYLGTNKDGTARIVLNTNVKNYTRQTGVLIRNSNDTVIDSNLMSTQFIGVYFHTSGISGSVINNNSIGIGTGGENLGNNGSTTSTAIYGNTMGQVTVTNNVFANNRDDGVRFNGNADGSIIADNQFLNQGRYGISFAVGSQIKNVTISGNLFDGNTRGIDISGSITGIKIDDNVFDNNRDNIYAVNSATAGMTVTNSDSSGQGDFARLLGSFLDGNGDWWVSLYVASWWQNGGDDIIIDFYDAGNSLLTSINLNTFVSLGGVIAGDNVYKLGSGIDLGIGPTSIVKAQAHDATRGNTAAMDSFVVTTVAMKSDFDIEAYADELPAGVGSIFFVTNTIADDITAVGSFAWAVAQANSFVGLDAIVFGIGNATINQSSEIVVTDQIYIDGYTAVNANTNSLSDGSSDAYLGVAIHNTSAGDNSVIRLSGAGSSGSVIRGLALNTNGDSSTAAGIRIESSSNNIISGNFFNLGFSGDAIDMEDTRAHGVRISGSSTGNTIGGLTPDDINVFGGNYLSSDRALVMVYGGSNVIAGNLMGVDRTGISTSTQLSSGSLYGARLIGSTANDNTIGGTLAGSRNVIAGITGDGIYVTTTGAAGGASGNLIAGNYIGVDKTGERRVGNSRYGVTIVSATNNTIGGDSPEFRNVISGNGSAGIYLVNGANYNSIAGNYIGTDANGTVGIGNGVTGIFLNGSPAQIGNTIGGTSEGARNVISGNNSNGIYLSSTSTSNLIAGNYIGTDASGNGAVGNSIGIMVVGANANTIGGSSSGGYGNVISGNTGRGIFTSGAVTDMLIAGNSIGASADGELSIGNGADFINISISTDNSDRITIGGSADLGNYIVGATNSRGIYFSGNNGLISHNTIGILPGGGAGSNSVGVYINSGTGNVIQSNSMSHNITGILLNTSRNANRLQSAPTLTNSYVDSDGHLWVEFSIADADTGSNYPMTIEIFRAIGGQGLTSAIIDTVNGPGTHAFDLGVLDDLKMGSSFVATATDVNGNTSEFSDRIYYIPEEYADTFTQVYVVTNTADSSSTVGSLRWAVAQANANAGYDLIIFDLYSEATIQTGSTITISDQVFIDGYSSGFASMNTLTDGTSDAVLGVGVYQTATGDNSVFMISGGASSGSVIRGLGLRTAGTSSNAGAVRIESSSNNVVSGNFFNLGLTGLAAHKETTGAHGVRISSDSSGNTIGGITPEEKNVFGGDFQVNDRALVQIFGSNNLVAGNLMGTDRTGTISSTASTGSLYGARLAGPTANYNTIGGSVEGARNIISGVSGDGIYITSTGLATPAHDNLIAGNYVGTDVTGKLKIANSRFGITVNYAENTTVGGNSDAYRNVISGNGSHGLYLANQRYSLVGANYIGVDSTGSGGLGNGSQGIYVNASTGQVAEGSTIGGTVEGARNVISANSSNGIYLANNAIDNLIVGNYIGTDVSGTYDLGNGGQGVYINASTASVVTGNTIGGTSEAARNVISNNSIGVYISNNASSNVVAGNYIGTNATGTAKLGNDSHGVYINASSASPVAANIIGGTVAGAGNVISGNGSAGVYISANASLNVVAGNFIGTDATGMNTLGNTAQGVYINNTSGNTIGGSVEAARNVISGNTTDGVYLNTADRNVIAGNIIGLDATGMNTLGNGRYGMQFYGGAHNTIGLAGWGNVIAGNLSYGINMQINGTSSSSGSLIQGNFIGTNSLGTAGLGNAIDGIYISTANANDITIGGTVAGAGNVIAGNKQRGIHITSGVSGTLIVGNTIGMTPDGTAVLANGTDHNGIVLNGGANYNTVGIEGFGNYIVGADQSALYLNGSNNSVAYNTIGVLADGDPGPNRVGINLVAGSQNSFLNNSIAYNTSVGIRLASGTNQSISAPTLYSAVQVGDDLYVNFNASSGWNYGTGGVTLQFFDSVSGQGLRLLGTSVVTASGYTSFKLTNVTSITGSLVATVTDTANNTSAFGTEVTVASGGDYPDGIQNVYVVTNTSDGSTTVGSLRWAISQANASDGFDAIVFAISGSEPQETFLINSASLISVTDRVYIDGYTQVGAHANTLEEGSDARILIEVRRTTTSAAQVFAFDSGSSGSVIRGLSLATNGTADSSAIRINGASGVTVVGNYFGLIVDKDGATQVRDVSGRGVGIISGNGNTIGGTDVADRNVFAGNYLVDGREQIYVNTQNNVIIGNLIGTDASGTVGATSSNSITGIGLGANARGNTIGGTMEGARNVISGNSSHGIYFAANSASNNLVIGNYIGTSADGTTVLGNGGEGIALGSAQRNTIGGSAVEWGNVIVGSGSNGILVSGNDNLIQYNRIGVLGDGSDGGNANDGVLVTSSGTGNRILSNSIAYNANLGIELESGANNDQAVPNVMHAFVDIDGDLYITYSTADANLSVDFFKELDGQGLVFVGGQTTTSTGYYTFKVTGSAILAGDAIVVTATAAGGTSMFSSAVTVRSLQTDLPEDIVNVFLVTAEGSSNVAGSGTFVRALTDAKSSNGYDAILFDIGGAVPNDGVTTAFDIGTGGLIQLDSQVFIDGYSQAGSKANDLDVGSNAELNLLVKRSAGGAGSAFQIDAGASGSTVRGLIFQQQGNAGADYGAIKITSGTTGLTIVGNFINTDHTGTVATTTRASGIAIVGGDANTIGGLNNADRNVLGGNYGTAGTDSAMITLMSGATGNRIVNNLVGVGGDGATSNYSGGSANVYGINISASGSNNSGNLIDGNVISAAGRAAVMIQHNANRVENNLIGVTADGTSLTSASNSIGILLASTASNNTIGGVGSGNVIAGASATNVSIGGTNNYFYGNLVGTDALGTSKLANSGRGVDVSGAGNFIGGTVTGQGNVIGGASGDGLSLTATGSANLVAGNYIGISKTGNVALDNGGMGIIVRSADNTIGAAGSGRNYVLYSGTGAINLVNADGNLISNNYLGLAPDGETVARNSASTSYSVVILSTSDNNTIGGPTEADGNVIVGATGYNSHGIYVTGNDNRIEYNDIGITPDGEAAGLRQYGVNITSGGTGNAILSNSIANNLLGGIEVASGSNNGQAAPVLVPGSVILNEETGEIVVSVQLANGGIGTRVQFFLSVDGQGQTYIGEALITDNDAVHELRFTPTISIPSGAPIVATATRPNGMTDGSTSEFSSEATVNRLPTITGAEATEMDDDSPSYPIFENVVITENDTDAGGDPETVRVRIYPSNTAAVYGSLDVGSTTFTWDAVGGFYEFFGSAALATTEINALLFVPGQNLAVPGEVTVTQFTIEVADVISDDGTTVVVGPTVSSADTVVSVTSVNDSPTVVVNPTPSGPIVIDDTDAAYPFADFTLGDVDFEASLTVSISFDTTHGTLISSDFVYNASTGNYEYQASPSLVTLALRAVRFEPIANQVVPGDYVDTAFTVSVSDGIAPAVVNTEIVVRAMSVNDAPVITGVITSDQDLFDNLTIKPFATVSITDPDVQNLTVTVSLGGNLNGHLTGDGFIETSSGSGTYVFTGSAIDAELALRALVFVPTENQVFPGDSVTTDISLTVSDQIAPEEFATTSVVAYSYNDAPTVTGFGETTLRYAAGSGWVSLSQSTPSVTDPDVQPFAGGRLEVRYVGESNVSDQLRLNLDGSGFTLNLGDIYLGGVKVGTMLSDGRAGTSLTIELTGEATGEHVGRLMAGLGYSNTSSRFATSFERNLIVSIVDGGEAGLQALASDSVNVNLIMPATPVPPPLIPLPPGALPQIDMTPGGARGIDNSFTQDGSFLYLNPVGSRGISSTNVLTSFGPMVQELRFDQFLGDGNTSDSRMERLYTNGWTSFNSFQTATQALLNQDFVKGSISDSSRQLLSERVARVVSEGIFDNLSDVDIMERVVRDFNETRRQIGESVSLDEAAVQDVIDKARQLLREQLLMQGGRAESAPQPTRREAVPVEEVKAEESLPSNRQQSAATIGDQAAVVTRAGPVAWSLGGDSADSVESALDSLFCHSRGEDLSLVSHSSEDEILEIVTSGIAGGATAPTQRTGAEAAASASMGIAAMGAVSAQALPTNGESKTVTQNSPRWLRSVRKLLGMEAE